MSLGFKRLNTLFLTL